MKLGFIRPFNVVLENSKEFEMYGNVEMNVQQQVAKNNAELQTTWTKMTWKTFVETVRRDRNRPVKV